LVRKSEAVKEARVAEFYAKSGGQDPRSLAKSSLDASMASSAAMDVDRENLEREAVDFFGRTIDAKEGGSSLSTMGSLEGSLMAGGMRPKKTRIWYKFNEGFSNAVKAKVFIHELL